MMDTYFDRADAVTGCLSNTATCLDSEDPRYFNGCLYDTTINRNVAKAKYKLQMVIGYLVVQEKRNNRISFEKARTQ